LRDVGLDYSAYNAEAELEIPETAGFRQQICLSGDGETTIDGRRFQLSIEKSCVIPLGAKVETRFGASYRQLVLRLDPDVLRRKLEAIVGDRLTSALEFRGAADFRSPWLGNMRRLTLFLAEEADSEESQFAPVALAEFEQALIVACRAGIPHNFSHLLERPLESPAPWADPTHRGLYRSKLEPTADVRSDLGCGWHQHSQHIPCLQGQAGLFADGVPKADTARARAGYVEPGGRRQFGDRGRVSLRISESRPLRQGIQAAIWRTALGHAGASPSRRTRRRPLHRARGGKPKASEAPGRSDPSRRRAFYWRYCWMRVVRRPARPNWSIDICQLRNSSTVSV